MKTKLILILLMVSPLAFADGGEKDNNSFTIHEFEPHLNLEYIGIDDTIKYTDKNKVRAIDVVSNIAVYDIANNKTNYVFNDTVKRNIIGFYFESNYLEQYKTIEFNNSHVPNETYGLYENQNSRNISARPLSNNLIIVTKDLVSSKRTIWICDKYGNGVKKEIEFYLAEWNLEIDVKNKMIRLYRQTNLKVEIKNIKY